jgi:hypothetical protein
MNKNTEHFRHLHDVAQRVVDSGTADDALAAELRAATLNLIERYPDPERALETIYASDTELGRDLRAAFAIVGTDKIAKAARPRDRVGAHGLGAAVMDHLFDRLDDLRRKHGYAKSAKESPMLPDSLTSIMKSSGVATTCAAIVAKGSTNFTEAELVEAVTKIAAERYPAMSPSQAFARIYASGSDEARVLASAIAIAKAAELSMLQPTMVGGTAAQDLNDPAQAIAQLKELGARKWPTASEAQQFERALTAPENHALARKAVPRPQPTTSFPMPR